MPIRLVRHAVFPFWLAERADTSLDRVSSLLSTRAVPQPQVLSAMLGEPGRRPVYTPSPIGSSTRTARRKSVHVRRAIRAPARLGELSGPRVTATLPLADRACGVALLFARRVVRSLGTTQLVCSFPLRATLHRVRRAVRCSSGLPQYHQAAVAPLVRRSEFCLCLLIWVIFFMAHIGGCSPIGQCATIATGQDLVHTTSPSASHVMRHK